MLGDGLNASLKMETDSSDTETTNDLDSGEISLRCSSSSVTDHETECENLDTESVDDDRFEVTKVASDDSREGGSEGRDESSERSDTSC